MNDLELLRSAAPAVTDPTPEAEAYARSALADAIAAAAPTESAPALRRRWSGRASATLAAAAAVAAVLTAVPVIDLGDDPPAASANAQARTFLLAAARSAEAQDAEDAREAPYWYVRSRTSGAQATNGDREIWHGRTTAGRVVINGETLPLDGPAAFAAGLSWAGLFDLPTETTALRSRVYELAGDAGSDPDHQAFVVIGDLLRESPAPPALRAALLRVAATVPGVHLGGSAVDDEGRPTRTVAMSDASGATESRLWLDPQDGRLLQEDVVALRPVRIPERPAGDELPAGTTLFRATVLSSGPVEQIGQRR